MNPKDDDQLSKLLKASPKLTPPESFYRGVLEKIERRSQGAKEREKDVLTPSLFPSLAHWVSGWPARALATACVLMIIVLVTKESKKDQPALMLQNKPVSTDALYREESRPALKPKAMMKNSVARATDRGQPAVRAASPMMAQANPERFMESPAGVGRISSQGTGTADHNEVKISRQELAESQPQAGPISVAQTYEEQKQSMVVSAAKKTWAMARGISKKIIPANESQAVPSAAAPMATQENEEWRGKTSGIREFRKVVIRTPNDWVALWNEHTRTIVPPPPAPAIDFDQNMVVGLFSGDKPSGGYSVGIAAIRQDPNRLSVIYYEMKPESEHAYAAVITQPYVLRVIPKSDLPVDFLPAQE